MSTYKKDSFPVNKSKQFEFDPSKDFNKSKTNFRATTRNYSMNVPKPYSNMIPKKPFKDPDVWEAPELQLKKNKSRPKISQKPQSRGSKNFNINKQNPKVPIKSMKKE